MYRDGRFPPGNLTECLIQIGAIFRPKTNAERRLAQIQAGHKIEPQTGIEFEAVKEIKDFQQKVHGPWQGDRAKSETGSGGGRSWPERAKPKSSWEPSSSSWGGGAPSGSGTTGKRKQEQRSSGPKPPTVPPPSSHGQGSVVRCPDCTDRKCRISRCKCDCHSDY